MYQRPKEVCKQFDISHSTLRKWVAEKKVEFVKTAGGHNRVKFLNEEEKEQRRRIVYCRVSSQKQKKDLERQKQSFRISHPEHEILWDIGSGLNYKRPKFLQMVDEVCGGRVQEIVVAHKDRLCRFSFELVQHLCKRNFTDLVVLDQEVHSSEQELSTDLMAIVHVFSCRHHGMRRYSRKNDKSTEGEDVPDSSASERVEEMDEMFQVDLQQSSPPSEDGKM